MNSLRLSSNVSPILLANIPINLNRCAATIQRIATFALRARNPIILACLHAVVIGLKACAFEALERLTAVVQCAPGLGKSHATNPCRARQTASLALDIHDAPGLCFGLQRRGYAGAAVRRRVGDGDFQAGCLSAR